MGRLKQSSDCIGEDREKEKDHLICEIIGDIGPTTNEYFAHVIHGKHFSKSYILTVLHSSRFSSLISLSEFPVCIIVVHTSD